MARPAHARNRKLGSRLIFGIAIITSAFLLFQVQLILGKFLLPCFGGTSAVMGDLSPVFSSPVAGRICICTRSRVHFGPRGRAKHISHFWRSLRSGSSSLG